MGTKVVIVLGVSLLILAARASAVESTYQLVLAGKSCTENSRTQQIDCDYRVGTGLYISIPGIGSPDTGVTFMRSSFDGDFYATYGLQHGCVVIKRGSRGITSDALDGPGTGFDFAFISPKNGKVYSTWQECQSGF